MSDVSMCDNRGCKMRETCYRYRKIPNKYEQHYEAFLPTEDDFGRFHCNGYWDCSEYVSKNLVPMSKIEPGWGWDEISKR